MKTVQHTRLFAIILLAAIAFSSCQKEKLTTKTALKTSADVKWVDDTNNEMMRYALSINSGSFKTEADYESCATVTTDTTSSPMKRIIDYGTGCIDGDGKLHAGRIELEFNSTDFLEVTGAYVQVTTFDYSVEGNTIEATARLENNGLNVDGNTTLTLDVDAERIMGDGSGSDLINGQLVVEWVEGDATAEKSDDEFQFTGGATGSMSTGETCTLSIPVALLKKRVCKEHYVKGESLTQISGQSDIHTDYGDGTCDDLAIETIDGNATEVHLGAE
jgi:hypothetical protein